MNTAEELLASLHRDVKKSGWQIVTTFALGLAAAPLALYGQDCLEGARPIFPLIDQNFAMWQAGYVGLLIMFFLLWTTAVSQRFKHYQECQRLCALHVDLEEKKERRAQKILQDKEDREARRLERLAEKFIPLSARQARSTKFEY